VQRLYISCIIPRSLSGCGCRVGGLLPIRVPPRGESEMIGSVKGMLCILSPPFARYSTSDCL
jgi:hypothetical protein